MIQKNKTVKALVFLTVALLVLIIVPMGCKKKNKPPETPLTPAGPTDTYNRKPETFKTITSDPENNSVRYIWDWGDNTVDTTEYTSTVDTMYWSHGWQDAGTYSIKVKAEDDGELESEWSATASITVVYNSPPTIDSIIGPGIQPFVTLPDYLVKFRTTARDTTDSVYVRFLYKKIRQSSYTARTWIGPKVSGSSFRDSMKFTSNDTFILRAIAKDTKGTQSDTTPIYQIIVAGPLWTFVTVDPPFDTTDYEFYSSPAVGTDDNGRWRVFIGALDGCVYAIDPTDGTKAWREKSVSASEIDPEEIYFNATPAVNQTMQHIYIGSEEGELYCISTGGSRKWRFPDSSYDGLTYNEFGSSAAFTTTNRVYVGCDDYFLYALQDYGNSCDTIWSFYVGAEIGSSPSIDASNNIYFGDDSGYVTSLQSNRTVRWRNRIGIGVQSSPAIISDRLYIGTDDGYVYALNLSNGTQIWRYTASDGVRSSPIVGTDGSVYFGCNDGKLYGLTSAGTPKTGFPVYLSDDELSSSPAMTQNGIIVEYTAEDMVFGVNAANGAIAWRVPLPGWGKAVKHPHRRMKNSKFEQLYPSPAIGPDGIIYVASVNAGVFAIDGSSPLATPSGSVWPKFRHDMRNTGRVSGSK